MFRNFSFEAASRHPSTFDDLDAERALMNVSPTSKPYSIPPCQTRPPTPPPVTMGDLAQQFSQQNLRVEIDPLYQRTKYQEPLTPPDESPFTSEPTQSLSRQPSYTGLASTSIRLQRQANTRWQCNPTNIKDLSALVEKMIESGEQCTVCSPPQPRSGQSDTASEAECEDEGVDMRRSGASTPEFPAVNLKYRRSGERLNGQACVSKNVRMRKKKHRRTSSQR